jgi:hypothetical protein
MKAEPDEMDFVCLNKNVNLDCISVSNPLLCPCHFILLCLPYSYRTVLSAFLCLLRLFNFSLLNF